MEIEVKGHSGCSINVVREDSELYIYKETNDVKYFNRLVCQAEKQKQAALTDYKHIRIPKIHSISNNGKHVSVKMDYVYSRNFVEFFEHAGFEQVRYFINALLMFLEKEIESSCIQYVNRDVVLNKFKDVQSRVKQNPFLKNDKDVTEILNRSSAVFNELTDLSIPVGSCHGDLTFSNILFNGNNYYLIDFLDSFIESPLLDIVKLRQDTVWMWSKLMYTNNCDSTRLRIAFDKIDENIHSYFSNKYEWYNKYYAPMQLMNFLRILQYAHDPEIIGFLKKAINEQLEEV